MHQAQNGIEIEQSTNPELDRRIRTFTTTLKKEFAADIAENPSAFRSKVIGGVRARLPRSRPGRKANPVILRAVEIYGELAKEGKKGKDGIWHMVALRSWPDYSTFSVDMQRLVRFTLRAAVHSLRYEDSARKRRGIPACV